MNWLLSWIVVSIAVVFEAMILFAFAAAILTWTGWLSGVL